MTREAREGAARARALRGRLQEATENVDGLVDEARSTLRRSVEFLEREGLRGGGEKSAAERAEPAPQPRRSEPTGKRRDQAPDKRTSRR